MNILFVASVSVVAADPPESRNLYVDALGLPLKPHEGDEYYSSEEVGGSKHFGVWPLSQAAQACFGTDDWPADRTIPQGEPGVRGGGRRSRRGRRGGPGRPGLRDAPPHPYRAVGQTITRLLSREGSIVGISYAPSLHD